MTPAALSEPATRRERRSGKILIPQATLAMTLAAYATPSPGVPGIDFAALLGWLMITGSPPAWNALRWIGMIIHLLNGTFIFLLFYGRLVLRRLPGEPWLSALGRHSLDRCSNSGHAAFRYRLFSVNAPQPALSLVAGLIAHLI